MKIEPHHRSTLLAAAVGAMAISTIALWLYTTKIQEQVKSNASMDSGDTLVTKESKEIFKDKHALFSYVKKFGPAATVQQLHALSAELGDCHQAAHEAGRASYEIFGAAAFRECRAECHSGCYHGATEAFFHDKGTANLAGNLSTICSGDLNQFFNHQCIHGIGHGLMAWSDYDLPQALKDCDLLPKGQISCYTGVFMENIVGGLAQSEANEANKANDFVHFTEYLDNNPHFPCTVVDEQYKNACYFLQTSRMVQLFNSDFRQVANACAEAPEAHQISCFGSMGRDVGGITRNDPVQAISKCSFAPKGTNRIACLDGAAQDSFWDPSGETNAITFCRLLNDPDEKRSCYNTISGRAPEVLGNKEAVLKFCDKLETQYRQDCVSRIE